MLLNNNNNNKSLFIVLYLSVAVHCGCQETNWWAQIIQQYPHTYVLQRQNSIHGVMQEESINTFRLFNCSVLFWTSMNVINCKVRIVFSFNHVGHFGPPVDSAFQKRSRLFTDLEMNISNPEMHISFIQCCLGWCMFTIIPTHENSIIHYSSKKEMKGLLYRPCLYCTVLSILTSNV